MHFHKNQNQRPKKTSEHFLLLGRVTFTDPMAFQHNPHITTTCYCCSQTTSCPQPPPLSSPCTTTDPYLISAIVSHLQQAPHSYSHHFRPPTTTFNLPQSNPHQPQPQPQPQPQSTPQFHPFFISLLQRLDALEASLHRFSSSGSSSCSSSFPRSSLKDAAARTIQSHFRAFLVRRSATLRHLNHLASIKSALAALSSSFSRHGFVDFDYFSHKAMDLLLKLDSIQSGNKMIRDSKRAVSKEIVDFLELVDGACVKRHQTLTRKVKMVRSHSGAIPDKKHNAGLKCRNVGSEESKLMANLRERVEKIGRMSKALEEQEQELDEFEDAEFKDIKNVEDEDDDIIRQIANNYRLKNGQTIKKNAQSTNAKKRVCFVENGNMIRVYDIDGNSGSTSRLVDVIEDPTKGTHDEEEAQIDGDGEGSSQSSEEDSRKGRSYEVREDHDNQNEDFTFSTPEPAKKIGTGADFRKSGLKIVG